MIIEMVKIIPKHRMNNRDWSKKNKGKNNGKGESRKINMR